MKNILFFCTRYPGLGGIEKVTEYLANELSSGYNVSIFSASPLVDESLLQKLNSSVDYFYSRTSLKEDILHVLDEGRIDFLYIKIAIIIERMRSLLPSKMLKSTQY